MRGAYVRLLATLPGPPGTGDHRRDVVHGAHLEPGQPGQRSTLGIGEPPRWPARRAARGAGVLTPPEERLLRVPSGAGRCTSRRASIGEAVIRAGPPGRPSHAAPCRRHPGVRVRAARRVPRGLVGAGDGLTPSERVGLGAQILGYGGDSQHFHWEHEPAGPVAVDRHQRAANRLDGDIALGP